MANVAPKGWTTFEVVVSNGASPVPKPAGSPAYDRLRDEVLTAISKNGRCYTNEARVMAMELMELRAKTPEPKSGESKSEGGFLVPDGLYDTIRRYAFKTPKVDKPDKVAVDPGIPSHPIFGTVKP